MSFLSYCRSLGISDHLKICSHLAHVDPSAAIGVRTIISAGAWVGPDVRIGSDCYIGPNVVIGAPGFGYEERAGEWEFRDHDFGVHIGSRVSIGANTVVDRGRHRDTVILEGTKVDAHCFIAHNVEIGCRCLVIANSMIAGSCVIGDDCWIGPSAQITDHTRVGEGARVGLGAVVLRNVPSGEIWVGNPARFLRNSSVTSHTAKEVV